MQHRFTPDMWSDDVYHVSLTNSITAKHSVPKAQFNTHYLVIFTLLYNDSTVVSIKKQQYHTRKK